MFAGVHPDCETMTLLASDGQRYVSINHYLKMPFSEVAQEVFVAPHTIESRLARLNPARRLDRWRASGWSSRTFLPLTLRAISLRKVFRGNPAMVSLKMLVGRICLRAAADLARRHLNLGQILRVAVVPFEEYHAIDAARIENCKSVYAYEDVTDGEVRMIPACSWTSTYRDDMLRKVAAKYGVAPVTKPGTTPPPVAETAAPVSKSELTPA